MRYTFDTSPALGLALTAGGDLAGARYEPLRVNGPPPRALDAACLRQLHTLAGGVVDGLLAHQRTPLQPQLWTSSAAPSQPVRMRMEN